MATLLKGYAGMRGWNTSAWRPSLYARASVRVKWRLYGLDTSELHRCQFKDDSYRTVASDGP